MFILDCPTNHVKQRKFHIDADFSSLVKSASESQSSKTSIFSNKVLEFQTLNRITTADFRPPRKLCLLVKVGYN